MAKIFLKVDHVFVKLPNWKKYERFLSLSFRYIAPVSTSLSLTNSPPSPSLTGATATAFTDTLPPPSKTTPTTALPPRDDLLDTARELLNWEDGIRSCSKLQASTGENNMAKGFYHIGLSWWSITRKWPCFFGQCPSWCCLCFSRRCHRRPRRCSSSPFWSWCFSSSLPFPPLSFRLPLPCREAVEDVTTGLFMFLLAWASTIFLSIEMLSLLRTVERLYMFASSTIRTR